MAALYTRKGKRYERGSQGIGMISMPGKVKGKVIAKRVRSMAERWITKKHKCLEKGVQIKQYETGGKEESRED